jgi:4-diphosphocytidyl-2-C-methyl-D-erythritol kinase
MRTLSTESPAKLNLTLRVLGQRPDGFHDIESLVARLDLCDTLTVAAHEDGCYSLDCDDPALPCDGSNLVLRTARALAKAAGVNRGAEFTLHKRIPAGAGLGGGSSNAAAALKLLSAAWKLGLSPAELERIGAGLGSDVPLFFHRPLCIIRGRGEQVEDVATPLHGWATLLLPELHSSTPAVYAAHDQPQRRRERRGRKGAGSGIQTPRADAAKADPGRLLAAAGGSVAKLMAQLFNDLEAPAFEVVPELRQIAQRAAEIAGGPVRMTGSGSGLFRLFDEQSAAQQFALAVAGALRVRTEVARIG